MGEVAAIVGLTLIGGSKIMGAHGQAAALRGQARANEQMAEQEAQDAESAAEDALRRGSVDAANLLDQIPKYVGAQGSDFAASGVDLSSGSVRAVAFDTARAIVTDAVTIKNNAAREAWGLKKEASNIRLRARLNTIGARQAAKATVLGGTIDAIGSSLAGGYKMGLFDSAPGKTAVPTFEPGSEIVKKAVKQPQYGGGGWS